MIAERKDSFPPVAETTPGKGIREMLKTVNDILKRFQTARVLCVLFLMFAPAVLTGCSESMLANEQSQTIAQDAEAAAKECWVCPAFNAMFNAVNSASQSIIRNVAKGAIGLVAVGYAICLALHILRNIASLKEPGAAEFWKGIGVLSFWAALCAGLLRDLAGGGTFSAVEMFAKPVFGGFVNAGLMVISGSGSGISCPAGGSPDVGMLCLVKAIQTKMSGMVAFSAMVATQPIALGIPVCLIGLGLWVVSCYMMVWFPLLLLDIVFDYGILLCLTPLFVAAYGFAQTRSYAALGAKYLIGIGLGVVSFCIFIGVSVGVLNKYIDQFLPEMRAPAGLMGDARLLYHTVMGQGVTGLIFVVLFLLFFANVVYEVMSGVGVNASAGAVTATKGFVKKAANTAATFAKAGRNLRGQAKDRAAKKRMEAFDEKNKELHKKISNETDPDKRKALQKQQQKLKNQNRRDKDRMEDRGYLRNGQKTEAYQSLGSKKGVRATVRNFQAALAGGGSEARRDEEQNALADV